MDQRGGGRESPGGPWRGEIGWRGQAGSWRAITAIKKPSEVSKASERGKWVAFGQTGSQRRVSAESTKKIGEGDNGECFAQDVIGRGAQDSTTHMTGESEPDRQEKDIFWKADVTGVGIRLASLNIRTRGSGLLETALQALYQGNVDVGFLQEKKLTQGIYTRHGVGYNVWATEAYSSHQGGVAVVC